MFCSDYLGVQLKVHIEDDRSSFDAGGFIDPSSHDVYAGGKRALALSSVPFDYEHRSVLNVKTL